MIRNLADAFINRLTPLFTPAGTISLEAGFPIVLLNQNRSVFPLSSLYILLLSRISLRTNAVPLPSTFSERAVNARGKPLFVADEIQTCSPVTSSTTDCIQRRLSFMHLEKFVMVGAMRGLNPIFDLREEAKTQKKSDCQDIEQLDWMGDERDKNKTLVTAAFQNQTCDRYSRGEISSPVSSPEDDTHLVNNKQLSLDLFLQKEQLEYLESDGEEERLRSPEDVEELNTTR